MLTNVTIFRAITNQTKEQVPACHVHQAALQLVQGMWNVLHVNRDRILHQRVELSVLNVRRISSIWVRNRKPVMSAMRTVSR